jgi:hypothetical protein
MAAVIESVPTKSVAPLGNISTGDDLRVLMRHPTRRRRKLPHRAILTLTEAEAVALEHVRWAELVAATDAQDTAELRATGARWKAILAAQRGQVVLESALMLSISMYIDDARRDRWALSRQADADVLSRLLDRIVAQSARTIA